MRTIVWLKADPEKPVEHYDCYPVIYAGSDGSIHIRNAEGAEVKKYRRLEVSKLEYQP